MAKNANLVLVLCLVCTFCASFAALFCSLKFSSRNAFLLNLAFNLTSAANVNLEMIYQARVICGAEAVVDIYDANAVCAAV